MTPSEKSDVTLPLLPQLSEALGEDHALMPGEFAGMYQAGFEAGYEQGREAGYRQGLAESIAAVQQGPNGAAIKAAVGKTAPKVRPRRMLLGMPCPNCRVYLLGNETCCPCCKRPAKAA